MSKTNGHRRVTLVDILFNESYFEFSRAVIGYSKHFRDWNLQGTPGRSAFSQWKEMPWEEADGLICLNLTNAKVRRLKGKNVSVISVSPAGQADDLVRVMYDHRAIGKMGANHLLARGYAHLAYIGDGAWESKRQRDGFIETIESAGKMCEVVQIQHGSSGYVLDQVRSFLESFPKPIGIMGCFDYLARHIANAAEDLGLRSPSEVGILGVNNNHWSSIMAKVPLSSIQLDQTRLAQVTVDTLDRLMRGQSVEQVQMVPPLRVVERQSTDTVLTQDALVAKALQFIHDHAQEAISVDDVLMDAACSRSTLEKRMKAAVGSTVHHAITRARVEKVKQILETTDMNTARIAYHCGFQYQSRLYEAFKRITGITPAAYRRSMRSHTPHDT